MHTKTFKRSYLMFYAVVALMGAYSCKKILPSVKEEDQTLDGPLLELSNDQSLQHLRGDVAFNNKIFTAETGLGSIFVANSCGACHAGDGKGHPSTTLTRFGQSDTSGNQFLNQGGPQLQNRALPGFKPETIPSGATFSNFTPPAVSGLGFIELVSDADIIAMSDPDDIDGDGISGVPNWLPINGYVRASANAIEKNGKYIHRFGKKAAAYSLLHQTVNAYNQDMGIASVFDPHDVYSSTDIDPEITAQEVNDVVFYLQTLKAPIQRDQNDEEVIAGKIIFKNIGCNNCHKEALTTGSSPIAALSNKVFYPYTDLLLHDMGTKLDDGYTEGSAQTFEWRTPALWGLGLSPVSQGGQFYLMHDGRARSIEAAINLHGGEATTSKNNYEALNDSEQKKLMKFLNSL